MIYSTFNAYYIEFRKIENSKNVTLMSHFKKCHVTRGTL